MTCHHDNVQWGWRIGCLHPGCPATYEGWAGYGLPPLPGLYDTKNGWFVCWDRVEQPDGSDIHRAMAYCPEHAASAWSWCEATAAWEHDRADHRKVTYTTIRSFFTEWLPKKFGYRIAQEIEAWETTHPRPRAPWERLEEKRT